VAFACQIKTTTNTTIWQTIAAFFFLIIYNQATFKAMASWQENILKVFTAKVTQTSYAKVLA